MKSSSIRATATEDARRALSVAVYRILMPATTEPAVGGALL
jgi:hypothetical protein